MRVPFFDLTKQYTALKEIIEEKICEVMKSGQYIEGLAVKEFEREIGDYLGVKNVVTCGNGTDALRIALQAAGVGYGDEVITTAFSFFATAEAIAQIGAIPVFADIDAETFNIDVEDVRKKITEKTRVILPVHIFGMPADMMELNGLAEQYGLSVIEDACQAIGAEYRGRKAGTLGKAGCFSFYPTKNLGAFGDGGMIVTDDDDFANACRALKAHAAGKIGAKAYTWLYHEKLPELTESDGDALYDPCKYFNYFIGSNSRLDSIQAAVLLVKKKYLDEYNEKRKKIALLYTEGLRGLPIQVPSCEKRDRNSCWHQYAILCDQKEELINFLGENGVGAGNFYPVPLHLQKAFNYLGYEKNSLPIAESICNRTVCLPIFPELTEEEINYVIETIKKFYCEEKSGRGVFVHHTAEISEKAIIGQGTKIWNHAQVREDAVIGEDCILSKNVYIDAGVHIGNRVKIQNNVNVYHGVTVEDDVFLGPSMTFSNDSFPRAFSRDWKVNETTIKTGASIGANATIVCGHMIGRYAMVGAGSVVTKDVPDYALVVGNPAKQIGWVCECGNKLEIGQKCKMCGNKHKMVNGQLIREGARNVLLMPDGSAILISTDSAGFYIP